MSPSPKKTTHRPLTVAALLLSLFLAAMEATAISTAMPTIIGELGGVALYAWVFTSYMLAATIGVPFFGKLSDLYGRKPMLLFGLVLFLVSSVLCGFATSIWQLIAFRTLQGLGAGSVQPVSITIIGDIFTFDERSRIQGLFGAVWGLAGIVGPLLGGFIVKQLDWQWVFFINVPFGLAAIVILVFAFHEEVERQKHRLDVWGGVTLTLAIIAMLSASNGYHVFLTGGASALLIGLFLKIESRAEAPILPLKLFSRRLMAVASVVGALIGAAMFSVITYLPLFVQGMLGGSPTEAGAALTPMVVAWPLASALSGRLLPRFGFRPFIWSGAVLATIAAAILKFQVSRVTGGVWLIVGSAMFGLGLGFMNTALIIAVQTSVAWKERGVATASTMFFRTIGGTMAVGVLGGILARTLEGGSEAARQVAEGLSGSELAQTGLVDTKTSDFVVLLSSVLDPIFLAVLVICSLVFLVSLAFPGGKASQS